MALHFYWDNCHSSSRNEKYTHVYSISSGRNMPIPRESFSDVNLKILPCKGVFLTRMNLVQFFIGLVWEGSGIAAAIPCLFSKLRTAQFGVWWLAPVVFVSFPKWEFPDLGKR